MKVLDLTHTIKENMPVYPGTEKPTTVAASSYETDGYKETRLSMFSHTGTHIDSPAHVYADKTPLDAFSADRFIGKALVIDCRDLGCGDKIDMDKLLQKEKSLERADFLLFYTGWDKKWDTSEYFGNYPCIDHNVLDYILSKDLKGIGFDTFGPDPIGKGGLERHRELLSQKEIIIIENLKDLDKCGDELFTFICLPIKFENSDGAPARAVAYFE